MGSAHRMGAAGQLRRSRTTTPGGSELNVVVRNYHTVGCKSFPGFTGPPGESPVKSYNRPYQPESVPRAGCSIVVERTKNGERDGRRGRDP